MADEDGNPSRGCVYGLLFAAPFWVGAVAIAVAVALWR